MTVRRAIAIQTNLQKVNFIPLFYPKTNLLESYGYFFTQYFSPIFDRTNKVIQKQAFVMTPVNMFAAPRRLILTNVNILTQHPRQSLGEFY